MKEFSDILLSSSYPLYLTLLWGQRWFVGFIRRKFSNKSEYPAAEQKLRYFTHCIVANITFNFLFWRTFNQNLGSLLFPFVFFLKIKRKKRKSNQESHNDAIVIIRMLVAYKYQGKEEASATVTLKGRAISAVHPLAPYLHWFFWCSSAPYLAINVNGHHRPHIEQMIICCEIESKRHLFRGREMASPLIR